MTLFPDLVKQESQTTRCYDVLAEILEAFTERDVRNFLFTPDAIEQPYFESPNFSGTAVTATLSSKRSCRGVVQHIQGCMVYIPAFNIANRNLGFGYHYHYTEDIDRRQHSSARFVHDETKGTFTTILQAQNGQLIITQKKYMTTTYHKRYTAWFERTSFLKLLHEDALLPENLVGCLEQLLVGAEFRDCPYCSHTECECGIVFNTAKHPFDDTAFKEGLTLLMGNFRGSARMETYADGRVSRMEKLDCELIICATDNSDVREKLRRLGAAGRLHDRVEDVWTRDMNGALLLDSTRDGGRKADGVVSELKAALRRERNRASARKSNMKKKLLNDSLKAAVRDERKRLETLRGRELELRRHNLELKKLLASVGDTVNLS